MALITVVVPIYNVENYLERCLKSIQDQSMSDFVVLCINDGSTDDSQKIIDDFVENDKRFISFIKQNGGLSDARNYGLERANSDYICFIDSDDYLENNYLELGLESMKSKDLDLVVMDYYQRFDFKNTKEIIKLPFDENTIYSLKTHPELLAYLNNAAWNKIYRTELFKKHQLSYPYGYRHQDLGTTFRYLYFCSRIAFIHVPTYNYLADRPNNLTQQYDQKIDHILAMIKMNIDFYTEHNALVENYEALKYLCGINLLTSLRKLPNFKNRKFVFKFIDLVFNQIKKAFPDFPKCTYPLMKEAHAHIYLNPFLLKWYYRYTQLRK